MKSLLKNFLQQTGYQISKIPEKPSHGHYEQDGLMSIHNHQFMDDQSFQAAYARGTAALNPGEKYTIHWRLHIALWAAENSLKLGGDFVECGVNKGFVSSAIMEYLDWNNKSLHFYLLDTFEGIDPKQLTQEEKDNDVESHSKGRLESGFYVSGAESVRENFAQWDRVHIIQGSVPETLSQIDSSKIGYLHLDMNCSPPEVATMEHLWDKLLPGAMVLMDDYAYWGFQSIHDGANNFAKSVGEQIVSLPTGQGIFIKH